MTAFAALLLRLWTLAIGAPAGTPAPEPPVAAAPSAASTSTRSVVSDGLYVGF
jgi:hypothetical protein